MTYSTLQDCVLDLEKNKHLIAVNEEISSDLEMAAIHLRVYEMGGPALLFNNIKDCKFRAASNLFGTLDRSKFIFRETLEKMQLLIEIKNNPAVIMKSPLRYLKAAGAAYSSLPHRSKNNNFLEGKISDLPLIKHWPMDGGAFVTLPQVYSEDIDMPGIMNANLGMYRIQLNGNDYITDKEIGLHYQLHRGIGVHQTKANQKGLPLKVSVFVGGPPSHSLAAVMPLPEGLSEMIFAGALGNRRFKYFYDEEGYCISSDADFVITGYINPNENKPEGPFGDHLGYYSLKHDFPLMHVHKVRHKPNAIWPFTVVGRPPQEDTSFGALIHEISGAAIKKEIPGVHEINAVDAAGVHPLLFAIGSERYTPYLQDAAPKELVTIANHILGTGQLSLAKYLFLSDKADNINLTTYDTVAFLTHILERIDLKRDLHFYTNTSIDTLDYSGTGLNYGSKVAFIGRGLPKRNLVKELPSDYAQSKFGQNSKLIFPGAAAITFDKFENYEKANVELQEFTKHVEQFDLTGLGLLIICDDASFTAETINNFLWVTFTRSNPANDIYGVKSSINNKHWGCETPVIIDARKKPHHAPELIKDPAIEKRVDRLFEKGGSLYGLDN